MGWSKRVSVGGSHQSGGLYTGLKPKKRGDSTFILLKRFPAGLKFMHLTRLRFEIIMVRFIQHAPQNRSWLFSSPSKVVHAERKVNRSCMVAPPHATTAPQVARHAPPFSGGDKKIQGPDKHELETISKTGSPSRSSFLAVSVVLIKR